MLHLSLLFLLELPNKMKGEGAPTCRSFTSLFFVLRSSKGVGIIDRNVLPLLQDGNSGGKLVLSSSHLCDTAICSLATYIRQYPPRSSVELDRGVKTNVFRPSLVSLDLSNNRIGDQGLITLLPPLLLHHGHSLEHVSLCGNRITDSGVLAFADSVQNRVRTLRVESERSDGLTKEGELLDERVNAPPVVSSTGLESEILKWAPKKLKYSDLLLFYQDQDPETLAESNHGMQGGESSKLEQMWADHRGKQHTMRKSLRDRYGVASGDRAVALCTVQLSDNSIGETGASALLAM